MQRERHNCPPSVGVGEGGCDTCFYGNPTGYYLKDGIATGIHYKCNLSRCNYLPITKGVKNESNRTEKRN